MMSTKTRHKPKPQPSRWYRGPDIPKSAIRRFACEVADKFHPEKIILFGSHAYGKPHTDSDVDILIIMPCRNELDQAARGLAHFAQSSEQNVPVPFSVTGTPHNMTWRLAEGDDFLQKIVSKGKVLYEAPDGRMAAKSGNGLPRGEHPRG